LRIGQIEKKEVEDKSELQLRPNVLNRQAGHLMDAMLYFERVEFGNEGQT
jgi:hypothetical protein